ncbi:WXG100 family type VII secretion target [Rhodococcus opacus]|uniref:WXG100 family type VII secretion target n=1 Tax=Rhodococcus opacus TaxID=37919 RepID=UPI001CECCB36|nr:WXG100 family type VII secretion target [Rhodococcus opacus]
MGNGQISYDFHGLSQMAADIKNRSVALNETHDELKSYVQGLAAGWDGTASAAYQDVQREWDAAHAELIEVLDRIARTVEDGSTQMGETEAANLAKWG